MNFSPMAPTPWYIFFKKYKNQPKFYENRLCHLVMYFATVGEPLHQAKTPYELLVSIFHAMLSKCCSLSDSRSPN